MLGEIMIDITTERNKDGFYTIDIGKVANDGIITVNAVISTASRLTKLNYEDVAKMLGRKSETVRKFIHMNNMVTVDEETYVPCYMDNIRLNGNEIERLYFILNDNRTEKSCIGLDIFANAEVKTRSDEMEINYVNEAYYKYEFLKVVKNLEPIDIENAISEDKAQASIDVLLDRIAK